MIKIDIIKSYQTRSGKKVRLISDQGSETYPIIGVIEDDIGPSCWTTEGYYVPGDFENDNNLIPLPQILQTLPYRRLVRKADEGYYVTVMIQDPAEHNQIARFEAFKDFIRWLDTEWITTSFELHL